MTQAVVDRYRLFSTSIVSDALDDHGIEGVIHGIDPAHPDHFAVGRAEPMSFEYADDDDEPTNFPFAMLERFAADRVLVIDGAGDELSSWGGLASQLAAAAGVAGTVIDGGYRDANEIYHDSFPLFAAAPTPRTGQRRVTVADRGTPVTIDGVKIEPDDIVIADATGVVVVPADRDHEVAETAEQILAEELLLEAKVKNGATVADIRDHSF